MHENKDDAQRLTSKCLDRESYVLFVVPTPQKTDEIYLSKPLIAFFFDDLSVDKIGA